MWQVSCLKFKIGKFGSFWFQPWPSEEGVRGCASLLAQSEEAQPQDRGDRGGLFEACKGTLSQSHRGWVSISRRRTYWREIHIHIQHTYNIKTYSIYSTQQHIIQHVNQSQSRLTVSHTILYYQHDMRQTAVSYMQKSLSLSMQNLLRLPGAEVEQVSNSSTVVVVLV